jgi:hypothetical protein
VKVLHLGKFCPPKEGGIELFTYDLLEYLNSKDIKADLLCFGDKTFKDSYKGFDFYSCKMDIKLNSAPLDLSTCKVFRDMENIVCFKDENNFLKKLLLLEENSELYLRISNTAIEAIKTHFSWEKYAERIFVAILGMQDES